MTMKVLDEEAMLSMGVKLSQCLPQGAVVFLHGELGAGKTTLTRGILRGFGVTGKVKSPTYTLVEPYTIQSGMLYHFDLYRLESPSALREIGIEEYFSPDHIVIVEWPEHGAGFLPKPDLDCYIDFEGQGRSIRLNAHTAKGQHILSSF